MKTLTIPCRIKTRGKRAQEKVHAIARKYYADHAEVCCLRCADCKIEWPDSCCDWKRAFCSMCYSDAVWITRVRLEFQNWGEQNGGRAEMLGRYNAAANEVFG